jgi:hypothetical protein
MTRHITNRLVGLFSILLALLLCCMWAYGATLIRKEQIEDAYVLNTGDAITGDIYLTGGKMGIGTSSPGELVVAQEDKNGTTMIQVRNDTTGASSRSRFSMHSGGVEAGYIAVNYNAAGSDVFIGNRINNGNADIVFKTKDGVNTPLTIKGDGVMYTGGDTYGFAPDYIEFASDTCSGASEYIGLASIPSVTTSWINKRGRNARIIEAEVVSNVSDSGEQVLRVMKRSAAGVETTVFYFIMELGQDVQFQSTARGAAVSISDDDELRVILETDSGGFYSAKVRIGLLFEKP